MKPKQFRPPSASLFKALYALGLGPLVGQWVLLLTTTGRKSGLPRVTALQYEEIDGAIYLGSSRGLRADWVRNIQANPCVRLRFKSGEYPGMAVVLTEPSRIADFLEIRLQRHPRMVGAILKTEGLAAQPERKNLLEYAKKLALVIISLQAAGKR